jgi:hypothetical protein
MGLAEPGHCVEPRRFTMHQARCAREVPHRQLQSFRPHTIRGAGDLVQQRASIMDPVGDKAGAGRAAAVRINHQTDHFLLHRALVKTGTSTHF